MTLNFQLKQHHTWSIVEMENLIPWERDIYVKQLRDWIEEENLRLKTSGKN